MPRNATRKHSMRHIVASVFDTVWMIEEGKLRSMLDLLEVRANGLEFNDEEIESRISIKATDEKPEPINSDGVAVLPLHGVLAPRMSMMMDISGGTSTEKFGQWFDAAVADPSVKAIVLDVNSPGGSARGNEELAAKIRSARGTKPIIAAVSEMAASAAYYVASAADKVVASPSAEIGSIGSYTVHAETSRADEQAGVKYTVIRSGDAKNLANEHEPLSESGRREIQERIDAYGTQFTNAVAVNRGVTAAHVNENYGRGKVFMADTALAKGMIDRVGTLEQVVAELKSQTKSGSAGRQPPAFIKAGVSQMDSTILAVMHEAGLCAKDASPEVAQAALTAFFAGRGETQPTDKLQTLAAIAGHKQKNSDAKVIADSATSLVSPSADAAEIIALVNMAGIEDGLAFAQELINVKGTDGKPLQHKAIVERIQNKKAEGQPSPGATVIRVKAEAVDKFRAAARDALLLRGHAGKLEGDRKPAEGATGDWRLTNLVGLAERCMEVAGVDRSIINRMTPTDRAQAIMDPRSIASTLGEYGIYAAGDGPLYNASGMYTSVMLDVSNNSMRMGYSTVRTTFDQWMKRGQDLPDFRSAYKTIVGELSDPKAIPENGEFPETEMQDQHESYKLTVWGSVFSISWQAIVNDQIGAFTEIPLRQGRSMRRKLNRLAYNVLKDNAALQDGVALFHASAVPTGHANLTTGAGAPSVTTLNLLTQKLREQKGLVGSDDTDATGLNLEPRFLLVPPALEGTALNLLGSFADPASSNANSKNIWQNRLVPIVESELGTTYGGLDTAWYLAVDPADADTIEYAFLQGMPTPRLEEQESFSRLGRRFRMYQCFGVKALDYRGLQKHNGA